jgi:hypothetical protein
MRGVARLAITWAMHWTLATWNVRQQRCVAICFSRLIPKKNNEWRNAIRCFF